MTSDLKNTNEAFIWIWLPKQVNPVVAGKLVYQVDRYLFVYGKSYRERADAIPLSPFELPLTTETFSPTGMRLMPSCLRDALPDAWGRRLIDAQYPHFQANELDYGLLSGSDRIGALDFQASAKHFEDRDQHKIGLRAITDLAHAIESGAHFSKALAPILLHGTSVGGARPKCLITVNDVEYVAKFSLSVDLYPILKAEFLAMRLAKYVGISVAEVDLKTVAGRDVLLVKRFDRKKQYRRLMLSGLSLLGLDEMEARYASYPDVADVVRTRFDNPKVQLKELYQRLVFNVLMGNTDDHARNHSAFWDGQSLSLTPAYDICPQMRVGNMATLAMKIDGIDGNAATLKNVLSVCDHFMLNETQAKKIITHQLDKIDSHWFTICDEAKLNRRDQARLLGHVIKSEFALRGWN